ncbi:MULTISPECIES: hypothetical protein [Pseudomonas]|uniref:hypothetical protein n=1 Tax=Pseudomonas guariconensis TaxID=1288410 RepID=UPI0020974AA8|nr:MULTISPECIES: hypothetical protein [Pseudomonas]MCO7595075.1 hypothetical protein [Pseudomonas guariconensis]MCU7221045.1 hypothetical protein [Pseudomonas brassicacearum]
MDYSKIGTAERVKLTIEAAASQDFETVKKLVDTCPRSKVEIQNLEYLDKTRMLMNVAARFEMEMRGIALAVQASDNPPPIMAQMNAAKVVWLEFCSHHDIDPEVLIQTAGGHHPLVKQFLGWCCLPPDEALVAHWRKVFHAASTGDLVTERRH